MTYNAGPFHGCRGQAPDAQAERKTAGHEPILDAAQVLYCSTDRTKRGTGELALRSGLVPVRCILFAAGV